MWKPGDVEVRGSRCGRSTVTRRKREEGSVGLEKQLGAQCLKTCSDL